MAELRKRQRKKSDPVLPSFDQDEADTLGRTFVDRGQESNIYILGFITIVAAIVRLFRISQPSEVVFDEVHFGGFGSKYIRGEFFMDVHPPLGKLLVAATGVLGGYNGSFSFKEIGLDYLGPHVPYVTMRLLPGIFGVLLVPVSYITMRNMGFTNPASVLTGLMLLFENGFATYDSPLLFFIGLAAMMWTDFLSNQEEPFTFTWWYPLAMTGVFLGLAVSVKWVGLFIIAAVGLSTLQNLWILLGDTKVSLREFGKHFLARALCLIFIPFCIYAFLFQIHFWALPNTGGGSGFMSPEFQSTLKGNEIRDTPADVAYGSKVYIRHDATSGGYLHSHKSFYPTGSKQQQITLYPFRDENSGFLLKPALITINGTTAEPPITNLTLIKNGDIVRLWHIPTSKHLHSHDIRAPVTDNEHHMEVSGYGEPGYPGDTNDHWRFEVIDPNPKDPYVKAIQTRFRLIHVNTWCQLFSHSVKLPEWGFGQQEVLCAKNGKRSHTIWRIEYNENSLLPADAKHTNYKRPGFWKKFFELNAVMWRTNAGLKGSHPFESRPASWPFLKRGISFWTAKGNNSGQIYLIGNPLVWLGSTLAIFTYIILYGVSLLLQKRQIPLFRRGFPTNAFNACIFVFLGWLMHYFPFFLMSRQLFLHHYFPALYFAILMAGALFDIATHRLKEPSRWVLVALISFLVIWTYIDFSPLTYGHGMHRRHCERLKRWGKKYDWSCLSSPEDKHEVVPVPAELYIMSTTSTKRYNKEALQIRL
ncbi:hypothetical protein HK101_009220 [Irineochytrium annulatum]|nr:hypothetical protein HK101_009220 [Irineochytrium annulatum]